MTADEPMSTPDSGGLESLAEREAEEFGIDQRLIVRWPWTTASPGLYLRTETVRALLAAHPAPVPMPDSEGEVEDGVFGRQDIANALGGRGPDSADDATVGERAVDRCPDCRHAPHDSIGFCPNMASDNDCACTQGAAPPADDANRAPVSEA